MCDDIEESRRLGKASHESSVRHEVDPPPDFGSAESCASSLALASPLANIRNSPIKSYHSNSLTLQSRSSHHNDDHSFQLFTSSFDVMSDADHYSLSDHVTSPAENGGPGADPAAFHRCENLELALPELKRSPTSNTDSYSLSDISPIKVVYNTSNHRADQGAPFDEPHRLADAFRRQHSQPPPLEVTTHQVWRTSDDVGFRNSRSISNPFYVLRSVRKAFEGCKYMLSCVGGQDLCPVHLSSPSHVYHARDYEDSSVSLPVDLVIAKRRVESAICAFGGSLNPLANHSPDSEGPPTATASSIFRLKGRALQRKIYEDRLPGRYYLSGSVISWELEEEPPIVLPSESRDDESERQRGGKAMADRCNPCRSEESFSESNPPSSDRDSPIPTSSSSRDEGPKTKYRCKLCGQLKQNHECSYRHSLQRSIGVMVYPAVNAYTAAEPGWVAPALTDMNNFVSYESAGDRSGRLAEQLTYSSATTTHHPSSLPIPHASTVTPASVLASASSFHSPQSSLSHDHSEDGAVPPPSATADWTARRAPPVAGRKRPAADLDGDAAQTSSSPWPVRRSSVFAAALPLRPEQFRAVAPPEAVAAQAGEDASQLAYQYPAIPLTFPERKVLSDSLFYLSRDLPGVTAECAALLREARSANEWDRAVAELLAQVVVGLYCGEGDAGLDGLRRYLAELGIAC